MFVREGHHPEKSLEALAKCITFAFGGDRWKRASESSYICLMARFSLVTITSKILIGLLRSAHLFGLWRHLGIPWANGKMNCQWRRLVFISDALQWDTLPPHIFVLVGLKGRAGVRAHKITGLIVPSHNLPGPKTNLSQTNSFALLWPPFLRSKPPKFGENCTGNTKHFHLSCAVSSDAISCGGKMEKPLVPCGAFPGVPVHTKSLLSFSSTKKKKLFHFLGRMYIFDAVLPPNWKKRKEQASLTIKGQKRK